jgi:hypothetical protein
LSFYDHVFLIICIWAETPTRITSIKKNFFKFLIYSLKRTAIHSFIPLDFQIKPD